MRIDAAVFTLGLVLKVAGFLAFGVWGMAIAAAARGPKRAGAARRAAARESRRRWSVRAAVLTGRCQRLLVESAAPG